MLPFRYVVRAAPGSARISALHLPSASRDRCNGPGWRSRSTRFIGASWRTADFIKEPEAARAAINAWVADKTEQRIDELLPPNSIDARVPLVLVNAVYFKGSWFTKFDPANTAPATFHAPAGDLSVQMMHGRAESYARASDYQVLSLPYVSRSVRAVFILPDAGQFDAVEARLQSGLFEEAVAALSSHTVQVALPRFTFRSDYALRAPLEALGMPIAFDLDAADFSGLFARADGIAIREIYHDAFVALDEQGTEAAAATAVVFARKGAADVVEFTADRPFLFFVHDDPTGQVLFAGRVMQPSE